MNEQKLNTMEKTISVPAFTKLVDFAAASIGGIGIKVLSELRKIVITLAIFLLLVPVPSYAEQYQGTVDFNSRVPIQSLMKGTVTAVHAQVGEIVEKGQILIQMDSRSHQARLDVVNSRVERIKIKLDTTEEEFVRKQELFDRGSLSLLAYQESENEVRELRSKLIEANAKLTIAKIRLARTRLNSPMDAVVVYSTVYPGMNIHPYFSGTSLMIVASMGEYKVRANVPIDVRKNLKIGDLVQVNVEDETYTAEVAFTSLDPSFPLQDPMETAQPLTYGVDLKFRTEDKLILPGTAAVAIIN